MSIRTDAELALLNNIRQEGMKQIALMITEFLMDKGMFTTCLNCAYWIPNEESCQYYKQKPPAKVIAIGCETHTDIPF